jgi:hypothetical protein
VPGTRSLYVAPESLDLSVQMQPGKNNARDQGSSKDAGAITRKTLDTCIHQIFELLWGIKAIAEVMDDVQAATKAHENAHAVYHDVRTTLDNLFLYANQANEGRNPTPDHGRESPSIDLCEPEAGGDERERHRRSRDRDSGGRESEVQRFRAQNEREENETRIQEMDRRRKLELEMEKVKNENGPDDEGKVRQIAEEKMLEEEIHKRVSNFASQESRHGAVFEVPTPTPLEAAISSQAAMPSRVAMLYIKARAARLSRRSMRRSSIGRVASRRSTSRSRARSRSRQRSDSRHASSIGTVASRRSTSRSRARSRSRERSRSRCGSSIGTVASRRSTSRSRARSRLRRSCSRHASRIGTVTSRKSTSRSRSRSRSRMRVSLVSGSEQVEAIEEDEVDDLLHEWTTLYDKEEDP